MSDAQIEHVLAESLPTLGSGNDVREWPADEAEFFRTCEYHSFTHRDVLLGDFRRTKVARAILAALPDLGFIRMDGEVTERTEWGIRWEADAGAEIDADWWGDKGEETARRVCARDSVPGDMGVVVRRTVRNWAADGVSRGTVIGPWTVAP